MQHTTTIGALFQWGAPEFCRVGFARNYALRSDPKAQQDSLLSLKDETKSRGHSAGEIGEFGARNRRFADSDCECPPDVARYFVFPRAPNRSVDMTNLTDNPPPLAGISSF